MSCLLGDIEKKKELKNVVLGVVVSEELVKEVLERMDKDDKREVKVDVGKERVSNVGSGKREDLEMNG